jgi:hypothetical protein
MLFRFLVFDGRRTTTEKRISRCFVKHSYLHRRKYHILSFSLELMRRVLKAQGLPDRKESPEWSEV